MDAEADGAARELGSAGSGGGAGSLGGRAHRLSEGRAWRRGMVKGSICGVAELGEMGKKACKLSDIAEGMSGNIGDGERAARHPK